MSFSFLRILDLEKPHTGHFDFSKLFVEGFHHRLANCVVSNGLNNAIIK